MVRKIKVLTKIKATPNTETTIKNHAAVINTVLLTQRIEISSKKRGNILPQKRELNQKTLKEVTVLRIKTVKAKIIKTAITIGKLMLRGN